MQLNKRTIPYCLMVLLIFSLNNVYSQEKDSAVFIIVEDIPDFNGKRPEISVRKYFEEHFIYPSYAIENNISGKVLVAFTVDANTWVKQPLSNVYVLRGVHPSIDYAAYYMVSNLPDLWQRGKCRGTVKPVSFVFPITFDPESVEESQITSRFDAKIKQLLLMDSLQLDSLLYKDQPVPPEPRPEPKVVHRQEVIDITPKQDITVTGIIIDAETRQPIYGANIVIEGTTQGTITDQNGEFSITAKEESLLIISFIGFKTQKYIVKPQQKKKIEFVLYYDYREL